MWVRWMWLHFLIIVLIDETGPMKEMHFSWIRSKHRVIHLVRAQFLGICDPPFPPAKQYDVTVTINWPLLGPQLANVLNG